MSMSGDEAYVLAMDYVDETLEGGGALKGDDGKSAYQSWLDLGNTGTEEDFINSLKGEKGQVGEKGETGNNGKSSYEIWLDNGNVGTEQDFLDSLKGEGTDGFSPVITENSNNTDEDYRLDIETKESKFTTPNLKANISKNIAEHNTSPDSHNDIRIFLNELNNRLNALANSDDETLDEMKEVVAYIKDNRSLIESITTTKVNVADIIDNLITNVSNKPLSASQGVVIKNLIDTLQTGLTAHINNFDIHVTANDKTNWNNATDKINNLEVGGTNLLTGTRDFTGGWSYVGNAPIQDDDSFKYFRLIDNFSNFVRQDISLETSAYIISFYAKSDSTVSICIKDEVTNIEFGYIEINDSKWKKYSMGIPSTLPISDIAFITRQSDIPIYIKKIKLEKGNIATDWTPAPEDKIEIADVNGLQTIADNSQYCNATMKTAGWYRIAEFKGSAVAVKGYGSNSCELILKRNCDTLTNEEHRLLLNSILEVQKFVPLSCTSLSESKRIITKIRYVYTSTKAYIDIYYNFSDSNLINIHLNDGKNNTGTWELLKTPTLVAESTEGETVSTLFDIPANANPVTDLDLTIDAIQGLRAELDELRNLITNS